MDCVHSFITIPAISIARSWSAGAYWTELLLSIFLFLSYWSVFILFFSILRNFIFGFKSVCAGCNKTKFVIFRLPSVFVFVPSPSNLSCLPSNGQSLKKFKDYLWGARFTAFTDNNPLVHLNTATLGAVEQRWVAQLASFDFDIKYRPGFANKNADVLFRFPQEVEVH